MPTFKCDACGAKLHINETLKTPVCEYCGSNIVLTKEMRTHIAKAQADKQQQEAAHKSLGTQSPKWNDQNNRGAKLMSMVMKLIMWPLFGFFLLSAIAFLPSITSLFMALLALYFLPISPIQHFKKNIFKKTWMRMVIPVVLFFLVVGTMPSASVNTETDIPLGAETIETFAPVTIETTGENVIETPHPVTKEPTATENMAIVEVQETLTNPTTQPTAEVASTPVPTSKPTTKPTSKPTAKPTDKPTAKPTAKATIKPTEQITATPKPTATPEATYTYIYNKNTKKFHYSWCSSVDDMKEKNRGERTTTRKKMIEMGYDPCGRCHP